MTEDKLKIIEAALRAKGIRIHVGGCGCCGSPWLALEVDGKLLVGEIRDDGDIQGVDGAEINMFEGEQS